MTNAGCKSPPLIFERSGQGKPTWRPPKNDVPRVDIEELLPGRYRRSALPELPVVTEGEVVRHYTVLSRRSYGADVGFYPLGSCTMKYNPKVLEVVAGLPGFRSLHPYQPEEQVQGALRVMYELGQFLCEIAGLDHASLQPAAGAQGELTGLLLMRAYFEDKGERRRKVIVPDSAHGTNPASAAMAGFEVVEVPSNARGCVDLVQLESMVDRNTAGLMLTNPNTLGLFEEEIVEIAELLHSYGSLLYYDGANMNAILGICRPGDMGFDIVHFNLHKTFATPHGGGGPGAGPIVVRRDLRPYLPVPLVVKSGQQYRLDYDLPRSIGRVKQFHGHFAVMLKAYAYILALGPDGLRGVSETAVLSANYLRTLIMDEYELPYDRICKHEFVASAARHKREYGVRALDIAKRILDYGFHAPTMYFPLIVDEALMIEPTETESKETLDNFAAALLAIAKEAADSPETVKSAPHTLPVQRVDEAKAARRPDLAWKRSMGTPGDGRE